MASLLKQRKISNTMRLMSDQMRISVIVATFNRSNMLRDCIESLLNQTLDPTLYEVIIIDNNSKDATRETVNEYLGLERYNVKYVLEPRPGAHYARNTGVKSAHAAILAFYRRRRCLSRAMVRSAFASL